MWLLASSIGHAHWSAALLKKYFSLVPFYTLAAVVLTLISQFARVLAFFLPLKVIILLGSTGIPSYFPDSWAVYDRDVLVVGLSVATVLIYLSHLIAEKLLTQIVDKGAAVIVDKSSKLTLFANQDRLASQAYHKLAASLATVVLLVLLVLAFAFLYPALLAVMVAYVIAVALGISMATQRSMESRIKLKGWSGSLVQLLSGTAFLLLFVFMVADFLLWEGTSFMVAIISILLSRQLFTRIEAAIRDALWLHDRKLQVNAIFFTGHRLERAPEPAEHRRFWSLLDLHEHPERLLPLLELASESGMKSKDEIRCRWRQSGLTDVLVFEVFVHDSRGCNGSYLLKIFAARHKKSALNEADLLVSATGSALPAPRLATVGQIDGFDAHLFCLESFGLHTRPATARLVGCWQVEPDRKLIVRYQRSHPYLYQRLSASMLSRLTRVAAGEQKEYVSQISERLGEICGELTRLPLAIVNQGVPVDLSFATASQELKMAHWGNWSIEPLGADLPVGQRWDDELPELLAAAAEKRDAVSTVPEWRIRLCSSCSAFEKAFNQQKYADAVGMIPDILACLPSAASGSPAAGDGDHVPADRVEEP